MNLVPMVYDWRRSVAQVFDRAFGDDEAVKCALAANLAYWYDDPNTLWWVLFAVAQGGYLKSGGRYVRGGSLNLSKALATAIEWAGGEILLGRSGRDFRQTLPGKYASALQDVRLKLYVADSQQAGSARLHSRVGQIRAGLLGALSPLKIE